MTERTVSSRWDGDLRAVVDAGGFELVVDEPASVGGTGRGPQPTELLLASVASCFTIAVAFVARKRGVELAGLHVDVTGTYDGASFSDLVIAVRADAPDAPDDLDALVRAAERVCYVTRTLARGPAVTVAAGQGAPRDLAQG